MIDYREFDQDSSEINFSQLCGLVRTKTIQVGDKFNVIGWRQRYGIPLPSGTREIVFSVSSGISVDTLVLPEENASELERSVIPEIRYFGSDEDRPEYPIFLGCHKIGTKDYHKLLDLEGVAQ